MVIGHCSRKSALRLVGIVAALLLLPPAALGAPPGGDAESGLPRVTIEAGKEQQLRLQADRFVAAVVTPPAWHQSLMRWNGPVCPLVVGLARSQGEYVLARISQAAHEAHAPLAGKSCRPNLFVVVTAQPAAVLKKWRAENPQLDTRHGITPLENFLKSTRPIRVWYDAASGCVGAPPHSQSSAAAALNSISASGVAGGVGAHAGATPTTGLGPLYCDNSMDTHLTFGDVRNISSAMIVADSNQLKRVTLGQLADYVSLVGLMNVRLDIEGGGPPTILALFRDPNPPQELTRWDRALLYSLYNTTQSTNLQLTDMEMTIVQRVAR